jgi:diaminopropionate ammonia-lyase
VINRDGRRVYIRNSQMAVRESYPESLKDIVNIKSGQRARHEIASWPGYQPSPLRSLDVLARWLNIRRLWYKDEGQRFNLKSFKALGAPYAVFELIARAVHRETGRVPTSAELFANQFARITSKLTVCCATDGNHGRALAWAARLFHCPAVIFIHEQVSEARKSAIADMGATVVRHAGTYDDSVRALALEAQSRGWQVVSDTSYEGYLTVPKDVMSGYTVMVSEVLDALASTSERITHVFVQAGVGSLAAAVCGYLWDAYGPSRPDFIIVEPDKAACVYESLAAGRPTHFPGELNTIMAGLACGEVSLLAWQILSRGMSGAMLVTDNDAAYCMRLLADSAYVTPPIVAGESAVAGLAGLMLASTKDFRSMFGLDDQSRVLVFGTESDTDPFAYARIVAGIE